MIIFRGGNLGDLYPEPKTRQEAIRAAMSWRDKLPDGTNRDWWVDAAAKLEQLDERLTAEGR